MDIRTAYIYATELLDTNSNNQVDLDKSRFILFFNKSQSNYQEALLRNLDSSDAIQKAQKLLETITIKADSSSTRERFRFKLPDNFMKREDIINIVASKGSCTSTIEYLSEVKASNISYMLIDENTRPSFEFRESLYIPQSDYIDVYSDGSFSISSIDLVYYRSANPVDIEGYENEFGNASRNINPEWSDTETYEILDQLVLEYSRAKLPVRDITNQNN